MPDLEDYYEILQVHHLAEPEVIQKAFTALANKYHPDKNPSAAAAAKMRKINYAYDVLRDPDKRKKYDTEWADWKEYAKSSADKPKPVVEPNSIKFTDAKPKTIQRASFIIRNTGGSYKKIWFSNPHSWVKVTNYASLTETDELPLRVDLEAVGSERGKDYTEFITVKLDDEENQVRIDLSTHSIPTNTSKPIQNEKFAIFVRPLWFKLTIGIAFLVLIVLAVFQLIQPLTEDNGTLQVDQSSTISLGQVERGQGQSPAPPIPLVRTSDGLLLTQINLAPIADFVTGINNFPGGAQTFNGIYFNLSANQIFMTQYGSASLPNKGILDVAIEQPRKVFILINTTDTYQEFLNEQVGSIKLIFDSGAYEETYLLAGQNVREYTMNSANIQTITDPANQMVWQEGTNPTFKIDMLTIPISSNNQGSTLKQIIITDVSEITTNTHDPGLIIWGLAVAHYSDEQP
jgi:curved DNA-binding protein CbpA